MRALTLTQPWAGLVASGIKLVENRSRPMAPKALFGHRFAIHASRQIDPVVYGQLVDRLNGSHPLWSVTSAVIGVATLHDALYVGGCSEAGIAQALERAGFLGQLCYAFGPTIYLLRDVIDLPTSVPCRGFQAFWNLPADVERQVVEQLR